MDRYNKKGVYMVVRGWWIFRKGWYSVCSRHRERVEYCGVCRLGSWENVMMMEMSKRVYRKIPRIWRWIVEL